MTEELVEQQEEATEATEQPAPDHLKAQMDKILKARSRMKEAELNVFRCQEALKIAKGELDSATSALTGIIDQPELPFSDTPLGQQNEDPEAWRAVTLDELGLGNREKNALLEAEIDTLGKIADWGNKGNKLTNIKGIGETGAEKIEAAMNDYWLENPPSDAVDKSPADIDTQD